MIDDNHDTSNENISLKMAKTMKFYAHITHILGQNSKLASHFKF